MNSIYGGLSKFKLLSKSYTFKFLCVAFLGIHIPLIGLIVFVMTKPDSVNPLTVFIITLVLTLGATAGTLYVLNGLLAPLKQSKKALEKYLVGRELPNLPIHYVDEAGVLMSKVQETITSLDSLLEEKKDLIGLLSHDLRAPLGSIQMLCEDIVNDKNITVEECRQIASLIVKSTTDQLALFQRILEILKNDEIDRFHLELKPVNINEVIQGCIQEIRPNADKKGIQLQVKSSGSYHVTADPELIAQVIKNLLSNAIKFSFPQSKVTIEINTQYDKVKVIVRDSGLGFKPEDSQKLFQRFTKAGKAGTNNEKSTGMGLYLSSKIVKAHQGKLSAQSNGLEKGANFELELTHAA